MLSKATTVGNKHFNPYNRPSRRIEKSGNGALETMTAPLMRRSAMCFNEYDVRLGQEMLNTQRMWMGSAMSIDEPKSPGGTLGSAQDVSIPSAVVAGNERIYAALEGALLGMEVDNIILKHRSKGVQNTKINENGQDKLRTNDNFIPPVAQHIWNSMKRGLFPLETAPSVRSEPLLICKRVGSLAGMPGGYLT
ncbi:hypothetical protein C8R48DRAFT_780087 [Suillus tomentosus]|nr:hypothetical protein C8R48DRAFT_780087 [Suillus tomentosus]